MKRKRNISLLVLLLLGFYGDAQQLALYTLYHHNALLYNPAMAGAGDDVNIFLSHRNQWRSMPGAPQITTLTVDGPLNDHKTGLGVNVYDQSAGFIERFGISGIYSYHVQLNDDSHLHFGLSLGILNTHIDFSQAMVKDPDDPFLLDGRQKKTVADANAGIMYTWKMTELGFSALQLFANHVTYEGTSNSSTYQLRRNYLFSVRQNIDLDPDKNFSLSPLLITRLEPGVPLQFDVNAVLGYKRQAWIGLYLRSGYSFGVNVRFKIHDALHIGYSYNALTSTLGLSTGTSHEIMLGYSFGSASKKAGSKLEDKYQQEIDQLSARLQTVTDSLMKQSERNTAALKNVISSLDEQISQLKKDATDASAALKMQIALLEERVNLLVKLIGN